MCAIAGVWMPGRSDASRLNEVAAAMAARMEHRGPDGQGVWCDPQTGLALSHQRLAIRDTGDAARQPMEHPGGRGVLVFNGELDNHVRWRNELVRSGCGMGHREPDHRRLTHSAGDTEVLLHALNEWGVDRVCRDALGMWAWAYFDRSSEQLVLSRDRLGKKPLYWLEAPWGMAFASQLQAFQGLPQWQPRIAPEGLAQYLQWGFIEGPTTILQGVQRVEPGQVLSFKRARCVQDRRYWSVDQSMEQGARQRIHSPMEARAAVLDTLRIAVVDRMQADVPVGAFLSGGIDSALVVALMQEQGADATTFSIGFDSPSHDESEDARAIAQALGTRHHATTVDGAMAAHWLDLLPAIMDEPLADASLIPSAVLAQQAAQSVKVVLTGDGGDEAFGGYARYRFGGRGMRTLAALPSGVRHGMAQALSRVEPAQWERLAARLGPRWRPTLPASKADKLVRWLRADSAEARAQVGLQRWDPSALWPGTPLNPGPSAPASVSSQKANALAFSEWRQFAEMRHYLSGDLLAKMDRATMWSSLEARSPILDHRVVDLAWRIAPSLKADGPRLKEVLRLSLERYLPRSVFDRPKRGFSAPLEYWLRRELRAPAQELLNSLMRHVEDRWNTGLIEQAWTEQQAGTAHHVDRLWTLITLELWRRHWKLDLP